MKFKICTVGCGFMSTLVHGFAFEKYAAEHENTELSACCDLDIKKAEVYKKKFGFLRVYNDIDEMLSKENPDAVSLIVPAHRTRDIAIEIIKKGYPLIIEKPPGRNEEETLAITLAAKKYNVPVKVAFNRRYTPLVKKLKSMIQSNEKDQLYNISYNMIRYARFEEDFSMTAIHAIDTVKYISGSEYKRVEFDYQDLPEHGKSVSNIYLNCEFENGAAATINLVVAAGGVVENVTVNCFENTYLASIPFVNAYDYPGRIVHLSKGEKINEIVGNKKDTVSELCGFYSENEEFFDMIRNGDKEYTDDLEGSLQSVIIADCIRKRKAEYNFLKEADYAV